jgi:hypothetical protein
MPPSSKLRKVFFYVYEKTGSQGRYALIALCNYDALGKHKYKEG